MRDQAFMGNAAPTVAAPAWTYTSVYFDGENDWLTRDAELTGVNDTSTYTLSFWIKWQVFAGYILDFDSSSYLNVIYCPTPTLLRIPRAYDSTPTSLGILELDYVINESTTNYWIHYLVSVNAGGVSRLYTNDMQAYSGTAISAGVMDITLGDFAIGAVVSGSGKITGKLAEYWFATNSLDISSETVRRKFISADKHPVNMGTDGSIPLAGTKPAVYLHNPAPNFEVNLGSGGGLTEHGTLTDGGVDIP